jgi:hypothetical protein
MPMITHARREIANVSRDDRVGGCTVRFVAKLVRFVAPFAVIVIPVDVPGNR